MTSIDTNTAPHSAATRTSPHRAGAAADSSAQSAAAGTTGDTVEISEEARELQSVKVMSQGTAGTEGMAGADAAKVKVKAPAPGTGEHDKFRKLMDTVRLQKSDVLSRIRSVLDDNGIKLSGLGKIKLEVDSGGRIVVGGVKDKELAKKLEKALNDDPGLAAAVSEYRKNEKEFSRQVKEYTGYTLYDLGMATRGQPNSRIKADDRYNPDMRSYTNLNFLGMDAKSLIDADDVRAFSFDGGIDFSAEISVMTDPESGIADAMEGMFEKVKKSFDDLNGETLARLMREAGEGEINKEELKKLSLNADKATITVDNTGKVQVEGELSADPEMNRRGVELIKKLVEEMLLEADTNSYGVNLFAAGSEGFLAKEAKEGRSGGTTVTARMTGGTVSQIFSTGGGTTGAAGGLSQRLRDIQRNAYSNLIG